MHHNTITAPTRWEIIIDGVVIGANVKRPPPY